MDDIYVQESNWNGLTVPSPSKAVYSTENTIQLEVAPMGMTIAEKILAHKSSRSRVKPGDIVTCKIDRMMLESIDNDLVRAIQEVQVSKVWDRDRIVLIHDHETPPATPQMATMYAESRRLARKFGVTHFFDMGRHGICHQHFIEKGFALPGQLIVGNDSHTSTYGAFNAAGRGILEELVAVLLKGELWFRVPETVRITLKGSLQPWVSTKDVALHLASQPLSQDFFNRSVEYVGPGVTALSVASRMVLANMGTDLSAEFTLMEADEKTLTYLKDRAAEPFEVVEADDDADLAAHHTVDVAFLEPLVAGPHELRRVRPANTLKGVKIDQAFIGTCTSGRMEDLKIAAAALKKHKVHPNVRMVVTPASQAIFRELSTTGLMEVFIDAGAIVTNSTCGACMGMHLGVLGEKEVCISTGSRNYKGRMGSPGAEIYLGSPATVTASAIAGEIADPRDVL